MNVKKKIHNMYLAENEMFRELDDMIDTYRAHVTDATCIAEKLERLKSARKLFAKSTSELIALVDRHVTIKVL